MSLFLSNFCCKAVFGGKKTIKTLYGDVAIKIDKGTQQNDKKKLSNYVIYSWWGVELMVLFRVFQSCRLMILRKAIIT